MENMSIDCCYYPTTTILVDDDERFLQSISLELGNTTYKRYLYPLEALKFLKEEYTPNPFTQRCLLRPEENHRDHRNIEVDIRAIHQEIYNSQRFNEIAVLVVDYAMPNLNGLEFCQQLKNSRFKIILLTGEADEKVATDLFNKGLISRFVHKSIPNFTAVLIQTIAELEREYFTDLSAIIINCLTKNPEYPPNCLDDPAFIKFFNAFCAQHKFTEYYLMDAMGSYLFLDFDGKPSWLVVKDENEMLGWHEMAELADTAVSPAILAALKSREKILYLHTDADFKSSPSEWEKYLHPASKLEGRTTYYYSYINNPSTYDINAGKVLSYKTYLEKL